MKKPNPEKVKEAAGVIFSWSLIIGLVVFCVVNYSGGKQSATPTAKAQSVTPVPASPPAAATGTTCKDVTSYDYNWDNDVLCTCPDGSTYYTNYAGGQAADPTFSY